MEGEGAQRAGSPWLLLNEWKWWVIVWRLLLLRHTSYCMQSIYTAQLKHFAPVCVCVCAGKSWPGHSKSIPIFPHTCFLSSLLAKSISCFGVCFCSPLTHWLLSSLYLVSVQAWINPHKVPIYSPISPAVYSSVCLAIVYLLASWQRGGQRAGCGS